jgi:hypothetical protein
MDVYLTYVTNSLESLRYSRGVFNAGLRRTGVEYNLPDDFNVYLNRYCYKLIVL